jgi:hypothetical protein
VNQFIQLQTLVSHLQSISNKNNIGNSANDEISHNGQKIQTAQTLPHNPSLEKSNFDLFKKSLNLVIDKSEKRLSRRTLKMDDREEVSIEIRPRNCRGKAKTSENSGVVFPPILLAP